MTLTWQLSYWTFVSNSVNLAHGIGLQRGKVAESEGTITRGSAKMGSMLGTAIAANW